MSIVLTPKNAPFVPAAEECIGLTTTAGIGSGIQNLPTLSLLQRDAQ